MDVGLTRVEIIMLILAVVFTIPLVLIGRWVLKELKKEQNNPPS